MTQSHEALVGLGIIIVIAIGLLSIFWKSTDKEVDDEPINKNKKHRQHAWEDMQRTDEAVKLADLAILCDKVPEEDGMKRRYYDLSEGEVLAAIIMRSLGRDHSYVSLADLAKVSNTTVSNILSPKTSKRSWKHTTAGILDSVLRPAGYKIVIVRKTDPKWSNCNL